MSSLIINLCFPHFTKWQGRESGKSLFYIIDGNISECWRALIACTERWYKDIESLKVFCLIRVNGNGCFGNLIYINNLNGQTFLTQLIFIEAHKRLMLDYCYNLRCLARRGHTSETSAKRLL